ncbi:hypothetical protein RhiLY_11873 [Ceratobasidium sp. AG-Ba]|nr:hypothetical protein RhiLY_11873 [Ceratobasidium sp. AG-Ba]
MADSAPATTAQPPVVTRQSTMTIDSDEKAPEPTNPPRAYDPRQVERAGQSPTEPATAVNSIVLEEGLLKTPRPAAPAGEPAQADEAQREIPVEELPLVVRPFSAKMRKYLMDEVDTNIASYPLAGYCFMTGYTDAITYTAAYVWSAFQTGNTIQCAMALAKLFTKYPHPRSTITFPTTMPEEASWNPLAAEQWEWRRDWGLSTGDGQALASLLAFLFGAFVGRLGDKIGPRKRAWLIFGTFIQALFSLAASLTCWANGESSFGGARGSEFTNWGTVLGFLTISFASAGMGLQAHAGVRIGNIFNSTVVLTTIWVQFVGEPKLFQPHRVKQRDHKAIAILGLIVGGMVGRALVNKIGAHWTFGLGFVIRILIALSWLSIPAAKPKKK